MGLQLARAVEDAGGRLQSTGEAGGCPLGKPKASRRPRSPAGIWHEHAIGTSCRSEMDVSPRGLSLRRCAQRTAAAFRARVEAQGSSRSYRPFARVPPISDVVWSYALRGKDRYPKGGDRLRAPSRLRDRSLVPKGAALLIMVGKRQRRSLVFWSMHGSRQAGVEWSRPWWQLQPLLFVTLRLWVSV